MRFRSEKAEKACQPDQGCQLLYAIIEAQVSLFSNASEIEPSALMQYISPDLTELTQKLHNCPFFFYPNLDMGSNQSIRLTDICRCIVLSFECDIYQQQEKNAIESELIKIIYLILYILLIIASIFTNLLTSILLLNEHKNSLLIKFFSRAFFCHKANSQSYPCTKTTSAKKLAQITSLNSISDALITCLLVSHWIITIYVIPNQAYLFYTNSNILDCRLTEFFKAFSVSLSIYSIVAISLQRFFAIKYSQYSCNTITNRLIDTVSFISTVSFIKSLGTLVKTIFLSRTYRRYLITIILVILMWIVSILIGKYNMSQYQQNYYTLKGLQFYEQNMSCKFPVELKAAAKSCTSISSQSSSVLIEKSDIIYMVFLLVIPNIIVLISYTWVCYHIWSHGSKLNKVSFRLFYRHSKSLNGHKVEMQKVHTSVKLVNKTRILSSGNSSSTDALVSKADQTIRDKHIDPEAFDKIIKSSTTQTIQNYHQFSIKKRNMSVTITTFCMVMCFSLCWAPFFMFPIFYFKIAEANTYVNVKVIIHLVGYSSAVWNPIILIIKSKRFKMQVARLMRKLSCCFAKSQVLTDDFVTEKKVLRNKNHNFEQIKL
ncbi:hypothetical protein BpHYR1_019942 [Brachionus plicatilis]|uniref:G-protein coupled receptors family 1 profile domain-containing protein n=1 Tax=Brachionus plicatilis TaxID=10195 RepID=A0A3M7T3G0_BRAPC|nr:hypothetical protein BpHYR1_019942 [Brachionus plicatilis]